MIYPNTEVSTPYNVPFWMTIHAWHGGWSITAGQHGVRLYLRRGKNIRFIRGL